MLLTPTNTENNNQKRKEVNADEDDGGDNNCCTKYAGPNWQKFSGSRIVLQFVQSRSFGLSMV